MPEPGGKAWHESDTEEVGEEVHAILVALPAGESRKQARKLAVAGLATARQSESAGDRPRSDAEVAQGFFYNDSPQCCYRFGIEIMPSHEFNTRPSRTSASEKQWLVTLFS